MMADKSKPTFYDVMNVALGMGNPTGLDRMGRQKILHMMFPNGNPALGNGGSGNSGTGGNPTNAPAPGAQPLNWSFPQYSQTWAFTPPTPTPVMPPPAFDPKSKTGYAEPPKTSTAKKSTGGAFSFASLQNKYGR